ncbi:MAG: DUF3021 domain-containing protein [Lachnospiraceae bacterium]|nr:DUF3021 domain-containing protein [Lachnospiraceae bacterium]
MRELKDRLILKALLGAVVAMLISALLCANYGFSEAVAKNPFYVFFQFAGSGLLGAVCNGGAVVYEIESWSIRRMTLFHYLLCMASFVAASTLLHWFSLRVLFPCMILLTVIYAVIWIVNYLRWDREIRRINRDLSLMRREHEGDES